MSVSGNPVISGVTFFLAHTPGLVRYGSKPSREIESQPALLAEISSRLRSFEEASSYRPNQIFLGSHRPESLWDIERPWFEWDEPSFRWHPHGEIMPEEEFYGFLKLSDSFDLVLLERDFLARAGRMINNHPYYPQEDPGKLDEGKDASALRTLCQDPRDALPLYLRDGSLVGAVRSAHDKDESLTPEILLENLACKTSATLALRTLMAQYEIDPDSIDYVIGTGEEAVGDRYQRGGGNLAKAVAEASGCLSATGSDVKAFCCGPIHGLMMAGALIASGMFRRTVVIGGCSLAKLGMKFLGHIKEDMPILEDVLAAFAILVESDNGSSPVIKMGSIGRHAVDASSQKAIFQRLVSEPLQRMGLRFQDIDKYATELQNPEITEPAGSGDVPSVNYRVIGGLATLAGEISRDFVPEFVRNHGMPGFSPTQGHVASAIPFLGHALERIKSREVERVMLLAKGSLFLGRMTQLSDGISMVIEQNRQEGRS